MEFIKTKNLFSSGKSIAAGWLFGFDYPWEAIPLIKEFILKAGAALPPEEYYSPSPEVWISKNASVAPTACILAPCIICAGAEIRHGAFIRGSALIGKDAVVGNSAEVKNSILFDGVQVPHFNYVGDSVLGFKSHLGAGAITSNVKSDKTPVSVIVGSGKKSTGMKKLGAMIGDNVEVGCNSVLNPGTIIGSCTNVYPLSSVRGTIPPNSIFKSHGNIISKI